MQVKHILELSLDLAHPIDETKSAIRAVLNVMPTKEDQIILLTALQKDIESALKGVETNGK